MKLFKFKYKNSTKAFSLVEILLVLAITAILAAITFPNFSKQMLSTRRSEAKTNLLDYSMRFEEYYSANYTYTGADTQLGLNANPQTENGYYRLSATINNTGDGYTLTAAAAGKQTADTTCATMTINNIGQKTPTTCW